MRQANLQEKNRWEVFNERKFEFKGGSALANVDGKKNSADYYHFLFYPFQCWEHKVG
jgi:hypothetical protein